MNVWVSTFYAGQIIDPECFESKPVFGSELALLEIFKRMEGVCVFISKPSGYIYEYCGITWRSTEDWNNLIKINAPKHIVISRYIGSMCDLIMPFSSKIWLWVHDIQPHPAYNGQQLSPSFTNNMSRRIAGIITVGDAQRDEIIIPQYKIPIELFKTIKNGINLVPIPWKKRAPMSFVYASAPNRGLNFLLNMWPKILEEWPYATLQIFHGLSEQDIKAIQNSGLERVSPMGKVTQKTLFEKLQLIDYWVYPCSFFETCCTTAIEMAYHGPICITNDLGALKENNVSILINTKEFTETKIIDILRDLEANPEKKNDLRQRQYNWAKEQSWDNRADEWKKLLK